MNELEELRQENAELRKRLAVYGNEKNIFARRLKKLRIQHGITQADLSRKIGIAQTGVFAYESGQREPSMTKLLQFANIFNVSLDWLCGRTEKI